MVLFLMMGCVSAANETDVNIIKETDSSEPITEDNASEIVLDESAQTIINDNQTKIETTIKSEDTNIIKDEEFSVTLTDNELNPIENKSVQFTLNNKITNSTTDNNGVAKLKITSNPGTYTVRYSFSADGYVDSQNSTDILVISTKTSKITAKDYVAYIGFTNTYTVTLTVGGIPLTGRTVVFTLNGKTYSKKTNADGKASLGISEAKGSYKISYSYAGEDNINPVSGTSKITVKNGMPTKIVKANSVVYRNKKAAYFKIKLTDARGNPLKSKKVVFKLKGKKYTRKTNANGIASLKIKLKTGSYKLNVKFSKSGYYNAYSKTFTVKVKAKHVSNNGMWLFGKDMNSVNLQTLKKYGFKHVFLNFKAIELYGKSGVENWVKKAKTYGVKVHLWMQVFYGANNWQNPVKNGKINYNLINSKVKEAKKYAKIKGIGGVHFDYVRYPGNAHNYKNSVKAINTFIKKATKAVHKVNKKIMVSAAVMPEPSSMKTYYGQDIRTMGKYLDAIVPMVYKGNYHAGKAWIKSVTNTFKKQSSKAKIWTGLQSYKSDANLKKLSAKELWGDCEAAVSGGANGVILFRYGLFNYVNFKEL